MSLWSMSSVSHTFRPWLRPPVRALDDVTWAVTAGDRVGLVGPSGCGKSTLIRCGLGLLRPDHGDVCLWGSPTCGWRPRDWSRARRRAQIIFQDPSSMLHPNLPIGAWLERSAVLHQPQASARRVALEALEAVGLASRAGALPRELSGGERRRVGVARVAIAKPTLWVADEPTAGLDGPLRDEVLELIAHHVPPDGALVVVSHDVALLAARCARLAFMVDGRVVDWVDAEALREGRAAPQDPRARALLEASGWEAPCG